MAVDAKKVLLNMAEENVKVIIQQVVRPLAEEAILKSENKIDDILLPFVAQIEEAVLKLADNVDGEVG